MKATRTLQILFLAVGTAATSLFLSCNKEEPTIATIYVIDAAGDPVSGATVRIYGSPSETTPPPNTIALDTTVTTDATGKVSVDYSEFYKMGQAGFAVLDVEAYKGALYGVGIIKVAEQEETEATIKLN